MEATKTDALQNEALGLLRGRKFNESTGKGPSGSHGDKLVVYSVASISPSKVEDVLQATQEAFKQLGVPPKTSRVEMEHDDSGNMRVSKNDAGTLESNLILSFPRGATREVDKAVEKINAASRTIQAGTQGAGQPVEKQGGAARFINTEAGRGRG